MKIAFDLRPLQIGHQYRGIGICLQNILSHLQNDPKAIEQWELVFYVYEKKQMPEILDELRIPFKIITTREILPPKSRIKILRYLKGTYASWVKANSIDHLPGIDNMDVFVQSDFMLGVPSNPAVKTVVIKYDIIPVVMESYYLPTLQQALARTGSYRAAVKAQRHRFRYFWHLKKALGRAGLVLAISEHTKQDLIDYMKIDERKITVLPLAADGLALSSGQKIKSQVEFLAEDWRFLPAQRRYRCINISEKPFIFYMGGTDYRRRISDLIAAYNILRAEGTDCALLLVGYDFADLDKIPSEEVKREIELSSYSDDIFLFGFLSPEHKQLLYKKAVAFVYPTLYEGFGLPILEAMGQGCPVICYDNSSTHEVGGDAALYANEPEAITEAVTTLLNDKKLRDQIVKKAYGQAKGFTWDKTTSYFIDTINSM